jgi:hypothetical protein
MAAALLFHGRSGSLSRGPGLDWVLALAGAALAWLLGSSLPQ